MKICLVCLLPVILLFFCYDCQDLQIDPLTTAYVTIGKPLTLTCIYTGNNTPIIVRWFLNNDTTGMLISKTTCMIIGTPGTAYEVSRYAINCSQLTISDITENDIDDQWGCTVVFSAATSPLVSSTKIKKALPTTTPSPSTTTKETVTSTSPPSTSTSSTKVTTTSTLVNPAATGSTATASINTAGSAASASSGTTASKSPAAGSSANATFSTSTPTGSTANATINTSTPTNYTTTGSTSTSPSKSNSSQGGDDTKVIVLAVVVPIGGLLLIVVIILVLCIRHRRSGKNDHEIPDAAQNRSNNVDGFKHDRTAKQLNAIQTTSDDFIIYPDPAAMSAARPNKNKKHHIVPDQYQTSYTGTYGYQTAYVPSNFTSDRSSTHKDTKHHNVGHPYNRPYTGTYGYQNAYGPSYYTSTRTYLPKSKSYDYESPHQIAASRPAYDQTAYYPQTGHYGQSSQDVYYRGGGQYSYGHKSRSHLDRSGRKQQREYYNQYEMADYGGNRTRYGQTKQYGQNTAFYY